MSPSDSATPERFDRYRLVERWLDSYFGMLWQARITAGEGMGADVSLRRVETSNITAEEIEGLRKAVSGVIGLDHGSLVPVLEVVAGDGQLSIISGPVDGISLRRAFELSEEPLPAPLVLRIGLDILRAVSITHHKALQLKAAANFAYGGLTPDSFVIGADGRTRMIEPALGSALRRVSVWSQDPNRLGWDPVEVLQVGSEVDASADVFSVGVMLWELLRGERFMSGSPFQVITKLRCSVYPRVDDNELVEDEIPEAFGDIIDQALSRDPEERFVSAGEMALAIEALGLATASDEEVAELAKELAERAPAIEPPADPHPAVRVTSPSTPPSEVSADEPPETPEPSDAPPARRKSSRPPPPAKQVMAPASAATDGADPSELAPAVEPAAAASSDPSVRRRRLVTVAGLGILSVIGLIAFSSARWVSESTGAPGAPTATRQAAPLPSAPPPALPPPGVTTAPVSATPAGGGGADSLADAGGAPTIEPSASSQPPGLPPSAQPWPSSRSTAPEPSTRKRPGDYVPDGL
ncbi:MAG: hypothetical protein DRI90_06425 [Deltaproteobacteria bacterium]|nr:MAG: hypothetical protein DRI90_06425 [Deltaproteobacteria bacterium]